MRFYKIYMELSDVCGLYCSFCPSVKNRRGIMSHSLYSNILQQIKNKAYIISLHVLGDPLYLDTLDKYIDIAYSNHVKLDIVSSGIYLKKSHFPMLANPSIHQISFSIDALYNKANRTKILSLYNLDNMTQAKDKYFNMIYELYSFLHSINSKIFINLRLFDSYDYNNILDKFKNAYIDSKKHRIRLDNRFFLRFGKKFTWHNTALSSVIHNAKKPYCHASISQLAILANGLVVPCCIDSNATMVLGDLRVQSFKEIIESRTFHNFRSSQMDAINLPNRCLSCDFRGV